VTELVIFVGGIHGVGKTTFCQQLAIQAAMEHRTVSDLIKEELVTYDLDGTKRAGDLDSNQRALISWLNKNKWRDRLILDGHFTLLNKAHDIYRVEFDVFEKIRPSGLICLEAPTDLIQARLEQRDGQIWSTEVIQNMADAERVWAEAVGKNLDIPICVLSSFDVLSAKRFVNELME
jgi:adenylate kinase